VVKAERRQPGHILIAHIEAAGTELDERRVRVDCVPEHDDVHHQTEGAELVLLAFPIALPQFAALAVKNDTRELVPSLACAFRWIVITDSVPS
jgi:hypothetical protein